MNKPKTLHYFNTVAYNWLNELEATSETEISINPTEGSWSLAELYDHVMRVARRYQIPNFKKSVSTAAERKKRKNAKGFVIFNLGIQKIGGLKIRMEDFPEPLVTDFTPIKQSKPDLVRDFKRFIDEVNKLEPILMKSTNKNKHYHPMFGDITAKEWFSLIAIHMAHHEKQKKRIANFLASSHPIDKATAETY